MRSSTILAFATLLLGPAALAEPTTQPTAPIFVAATDSPATQPARMEKGTILVLPLAESAGTSYAWLSRAIQQDILAELGRTTNSRVEAPASVPAAADAAEAQDTGHKAGATLVVYGRYQVVGDQLRVTGQILDVATGNPGGSFSATGQMNNLFPVEDSVTNQLLRALPPGWQTVALPMNQNPQSPAPVPPAAPQVTAPLPQYYSYTYPDYSSSYVPDSYYYGGYPYYGYGVPYYGPDLWFYGGWGGYYHHFGYGGWDGYRGHEFEHGIPGGFGHAPAHFGGGDGFHGGGGHGGGHGGRR